ncbi:MAG: chalcone isomerase family protein, partial [Aeromonas veronii]
GHFWWQEKPLGTLADPQFSAAFLAIWLADNSRDPALTRRLRGQP